jgi:uncharacterized protein
MNEIDRDRDASGRARNARPRDGLGRPLPRGSAAGPQRAPDHLDMSVDDAVTLAQSYLDAGHPFHAHEVLEALWKTQPATERDLWQGLAQIAVGLTHALRGNPVGGATLLRRGASRLGDYAGPAHGIDVSGVLVFSFGVANELAEGVDLPVEDTSMRLRPAAG